MIRRWYIPSESGDFRLLREEDPEVSRLVVMDPSASEKSVLSRFFSEAVENGWLASAPSLDIPVQSVLLQATPEEAGSALGGLVAGEDGLTVLRVGGAVIPVEGATPGGATGTRELSDEEAEGLKKAKTGEAEASVVTTRRPTLCCPVPGPGPDVRASEVLKAFCTRRQWEDWTEKGYLHVTGHLSGHRYRVHHRHHPAAARNQYITVDLDDSQVLHGYMWSVPPAEEVLAFKLYLEHAEPYVRNEASGFGAWFKRLRLDRNRYGALAFGLADRGFHEGMGLGLKMFGGEPLR